MGGWGCWGGGCAVPMPGWGGSKVEETPLSCGARCNMCVCGGSSKLCLGARFSAASLWGGEGYGAEWGEALNVKEGEDA